MSRIYLVDDHPVVREGLRALVEAAGHAVVGESAEPTGAIGEIVRLHPDIVLVDLGLDTRSGFELLRDLRRRELDVRAIVVTASAQPRHVAEALREGASGYVLKGSARTELVRAVAEVSQGRRYLAAEVADLAVQGLAAPAEEDPLAQLSPRERQIIALVVKGHTSPAIAQQLHLSPKTVDTYRSRLMAKLGVTEITGLVRLAVRTGLIDPSDG